MLLWLSRCVLCIFFRPSVCHITALWLIGVHIETVSWTALLCPPPLCDQLNAFCLPEPIDLTKDARDQDIQKALMLSMQDIKELPAPESGVVSLEEQELSRSGSHSQGGVCGNELLAMPRGGLPFYQLLCCVCALKVCSCQRRWFGLVL